MEEGFWIGREHNFQFSFYRAAQIRLNLLFNFLMHQFASYNTVFKVIIVNNSLNTYTHGYSRTVNDTSIPFCRGAWFLIK